MYIYIYIYILTHIHPCAYKHNFQPKGQLPLLLKGGLQATARQGAPLLIS